MTGHDQVSQTYDARRSVVLSTSPTGMALGGSSPATHEHANVRRVASSSAVVVTKAGHSARLALTPPGTAHRHTSTFEHRHGNGGNRGTGRRENRFEMRMTPSPADSPDCRQTKVTGDKCRVLC
jgi:hypothetical protein